MNARMAARLAQIRPAWRVARKVAHFRLDGARNGAHHPDLAAHPLLGRLQMPRNPIEFAAGIATAAQDDTAEPPLPRGVWAAVGFMIAVWLGLILVVGSAVL